MPVQRPFVDVTQRQGVIDSPDSFVNLRVELIALTVDEDSSAIVKPHPGIAGKGKTLGDGVGPVVDEADWECVQPSLTYSAPSSFGRRLG